MHLTDPCKSLEGACRPAFRMGYLSRFIESKGPAKYIFIDWTKVPERTWRLFSKRLIDRETGRKTTKSTLDEFGRWLTESRLMGYSGSETWRGIADVAKDAIEWPPQTSGRCEIELRFAFVSAGNIYTFNLVFCSKVPFVEIVLESPKSFATLDFDGNVIDSTFSIS